MSRGEAEQEEGREEGESSETGVGKRHVQCEQQVGCLEFSFAFTCHTGFGISFFLISGRLQAFSTLCPCALYAFVNHDRPDWEVRAIEKTSPYKSAPLRVFALTKLLGINPHQHLGGDSTHYQLTAMKSGGGLILYPELYKARTLSPRASNAIRPDIRALTSSFNLNSVP